MFYNLYLLAYITVTGSPDYIIATTKLITGSSMIKSMYGEHQHGQTRDGPPVREGPSPRAKH